MAVETSRLARLRAVELSRTGFRRLAALGVLMLFAIVSTGATVRLTASGLGCDNWPRCGDKPYPEKGGHAAIEFGNRLVALIGIALTVIVWLAARRVDGLPRWVRNIALATAPKSVEKPDDAIGKVHSIDSFSLAALLRP